eukprot:1441286-Pleurochrysis_carterae.AAC.2
MRASLEGAAIKAGAQVGALHTRCVRGHNFGHLCGQICQLVSVHLSTILVICLARAREVGFSILGSACMLACTTADLAQPRRVRAESANTYMRNSCEVRRRVGLRAGGRAYT